MSHARSRMYQFMTGSPIAARIVHSPRLKTTALRSAVVRARLSRHLEHLGRDLADRLGLATRRDMAELQRQLRDLESQLERADTRASRRES